MATDEFGEKTEQPTDRRRQEARQKGNVARSTDLNAAGLMLAVAACLFFFGASLLQTLGRLMQVFLSEPAWTQADRMFVFQQAVRVSEVLAAEVLPVMLVMAATALALNILQVGFLFAPDALQPKLSRLSPMEGFKRIFSIRALVKLAVSLGKLAVLVTIAGWWITWQLPGFLNSMGTEPGELALQIKSSTTGLAFALALALVLLALLDFGFQKWKHEQDLKMTKHEIREEMKQMDGDPHIRQRRREAHRKLAEAREVQQAADADVVITNPTEIAVALKYDPQKTPAPMVLAKGMGPIAARIRQIAAENGIPIIERKPLARALYRDVKVGQMIPVDMYEVFVEIMAYVYRLTGRTPPNLE